MHLTVYDGSNGIGRNRIHLEEMDRNVILYFGKNSGKYDEFCKEFIKNRDARDMHDLLYLDFHPKFNIYCANLNSSYLPVNLYPALDVAAVFLTRAHLYLMGQYRNAKKIYSNMRQLN